MDKVKIRRGHLLQGRYRKSLLQVGDKFTDAIGTFSGTADESRGTDDELCTRVPLVLSLLNSTSFRLTF